MCDVGLENCGGWEATVSMSWRRVGADWRERACLGGTPEPSSSLLLKQLSMMRRFSSSKRSARLMPGLADMVASP